MARLTAAKRRAIPKSQMGLPSKSKKGKGANSGTYPMPDKQHAILAKAFAKRNATPAQRKEIDAKANRILGGKSRKSRVAK